MKRTFASLLVALAFPAGGFAIDFDSDEFGQSLGGWDDKDGVAARYITDRTTFRTYRPTVTKTPEGGIFISTRITQMGTASEQELCYLHMTFDSDGKIVSSQVKIKLGGKAYDTKIVLAKPVEKYVPKEDVEPPAEKISDPHPDPSAEVTTEVFQKLDDILQQWQEEVGKPVERRDLIGRLLRHRDKGRTGSSDIAAMVRHNYNLIASAVR
ncbi:MAG: hypothetical protein R3F11_26055 [Verrucomicrobiales bacterium]